MNWFKNILIIIGLKSETGKDGLNGKDGERGFKH